MGLKSLFGKLSGGGKSERATQDASEYQGYVIVPAPKKSGGQYYTAGYITKEFPDGPREQYFIRADAHGDRENAIQHAAFKGRQIIDEQGDKLFKD